MRTNTHLLLFLLLFSISGLNAQTTKQYDESEIGQLVTDLNAGTYDIYELTTPGGNYVIPSGSSATTPSKSFTLKAGDSLAQKPKISISRTATSTTTYMFNPSATITATFEGIEFDGLNLANTATAPNFCRIASGKENTQIIIKDCYFHNFSNAAGIFRLDATGTSIDIQNSTFKNNNAHIIYCQTKDLNYGDIYLKNNTLSDNTGNFALVNFASGTKGRSITIDHVTINNFESTTNLFKLTQLEGTLQINNSIFTNIGGGIDYPELNISINSCYLNGFATVPTGTNSFTGVTPEYKDADNLNYGLNNKDSFICTDGLPAGNTMYYLGSPVGINDDVINSELYFLLQGNSLQVFEAGIVEIFDMQGKKVCYEINKANIDLNLNAGIYILKFSALNGKQIIKKISF